MENISPKSPADFFKEFEKIVKENDVNNTEENFLRRFLIGHHYDIFAALKSVQNYESFIHRHKETWLHLKRSQIEKVMSSQIVEVLEKTGLQDQLILWIRLDNWDPQYTTADEILQVSGVLCELVYLKYKDVKNIDIILDLNNLSLKHIYGLSPKFAKRMVFFMSECLPMYMLHIYVVRQPKIFYLVYSLFKPFLEENIRKSIKICGWNFEVLLVTIGKDNLPVELDGLGDDLDPNRWLKLFYKKKNQIYLQKLGYEFF
ncbi:unnamed protein product [Psylliodes chrysocephalus]|uniref:CRAL-TRIO domain-containing protein n=1 Tax=Psylliodes chrysocephalus TaxID=3402493 RepID=A0A9P0CM36_9CUCU|nr:unnamed protein product [Psylliodes chrysocephala]